MDWFEWMESNQDLVFELSRIISKLEAKKEHVNRLQGEIEQQKSTIHELRSEGVHLSTALYTKMQDNERLYDIQLELEQEFD